MITLYHIKNDRTVIVSGKHITPPLTLDPMQMGHSSCDNEMTLCKGCLLPYFGKMKQVTKVTFFVN